MTRIEIAVRVYAARIAAGELPTVAWAYTVADEFLAHEANERAARHLDAATEGLARIALERKDGLATIAEATPRKPGEPLPPR